MSAESSLPSIWTETRCPTCRGSGREVCVYCGGSTRLRYGEFCPGCEGRGNLSTRCIDCEGTGRKHSTEAPAGTLAGASIW
jgi:DnaJ-class molecular chaperone